MSTQQKINRQLVLGLLALGLGLVSCAGRSSHSAVADPEVPRPLFLEGGSAFEAAARITLPAAEPEQFPGLEHVFHLSVRIISGAEPGGQAALEQLRSWGVKTILSVDGKAPDAEAARALGLRYVHVPIQYAGITPEQTLAIVKTFRELEAPFYVHCYHGRHRGPAAAALGRVVLDGLSRQEAIAEMRQWSATAPAYEGLYGAVATAPLPCSAQTSAHAYDFPEVHQVEGVRAIMVELARRWGHFKHASQRGWRADPDHPDVDLLQEALQAQQLLGRLEASDIQEAGYLAAVSASRLSVAELVEVLRRGDPPAEAFQAAHATCLGCHAEHRNR